MKKIFISALAALSLAACTETINDKAENIIEQDMQKTLLNPDSYDALETSADSAFAPIDNPEIFSLLFEIAGENVTINTIQNNIEELKKNMVNAKTGMNLAKNGTANNYGDAIDKYKEYYEKCEQQINEITPQLELINDRIKEKLDKVKSKLNEEKKFTGYKCFHKYSAKNNDGKELTDSCYYLLDKDLSKVLFSMPLDKYKMFLETLELVKSNLQTLSTDSLKD